MSLSMNTFNEIIAQLRQVKGGRVAIGFSYLGCTHIFGMHKSEPTRGSRDVWYWFKITDIAWNDWEVFARKTRSDARDKNMGPITYILHYNETEMKLEIFAYYPEVGMRDKENLYQLCFDDIEGGWVHPELSTS